MFFFRSSILTIYMAVLFSVMASTANAEIEQKSDNNAEPRCKSKLSRSGRPHRIETIAAFNAVINWVNAAKKLSPEYGNWNLADKSSIKCNKNGKSDFYSCFAEGNPCRPAKVKP